MHMENHLQMWQLQSDAENMSDQNCGVQTFEPRALKTDRPTTTTTLKIPCSASVICVV